MRLVTSYAAVIVGVLSLGCSANARTMINIWSGIAPGSEKWTWRETVFHDVSFKGTYVGTVYEDVVTPTLTLYLPPHDKSDGTGIIVAPGGGCLSLVMQPAEEVARWFEQKGIAAFVLKYRLQRHHLQGRTQLGPLPNNLNEDVACKWGVEDGAQALKVVREHAKQWGVSPHRIGFMGFSAGGYISSLMLTQIDAAKRPDFVGLFYGAPFASMPAIPAKLPSNYQLAYKPLPPVYMAWAQDDPIAASSMLRFLNLLVAEGYKPEAHIYYAGGHGFAQVKPETTSRHWLQEFYWWLEARGFAKQLK